MVYKDNSYVNFNLSKISNVFSFELAMKFSENQRHVASTLTNWIFSPIFDEQYSTKW